MDGNYNYGRVYKFIDSSKEFFDETLNKKRVKRRRIRMLPEQIRYLEDCYKLNRKPTFDERERIGENIKLPQKNIQIWFQNRRAKDRSTEVKETKECLKDMLQGKYYGNKFNLSTFTLNNNEDFEFN